MAVLTSDIAKLMWRGLNDVFDQNNMRHASIAKTLFRNYTSDQNFEEDQEIIGLTVAAEKAETAAIAFDNFKQSFNTRYIHKAYGLAVTISREAIDDNKYKGQMETAMKMLGDSAKEATELTGHDVFLRAFNSTYTGGDGVELLSTAHVNASGGTYSNHIATDADYSDSAIEAIQLIVEKWTNDKGHRINAHLQDLIIPPDLRHDVYRSLHSPLKSGTGDNDANSLKEQGVIKSTIVSPYLTDIDAFFVTTDVDPGLKYFERIAPQLEQDNDFMTKDLHYSVYFREVFGWTNPKGLAGAPGA